MKKYFLLIAYHLLLITFSFSQNPLVKQWDYRFGGTNNDYLIPFQQTKDGGYVLGGNSASGISGDKTQASWGGFHGDYWIVKIDSIGNKQWDKDFGGTEDDYLFSISQTSDGGFISEGILSPASAVINQKIFGIPAFFVLIAQIIGL